MGNFDLAVKRIRTLFKRSGVMGQGIAAHLAAQLPKFAPPKPAEPAAPAARRSVARCRW